MIELARAGARLSATSSSAARSCPPARARCPRFFERPWSRRRARRDARADRQHDPGRVPREPERAARLPRDERAFGAAVARRQRDHARGRRTRAARAARAARRRDPGARLSRGAERDARSTAASRRTSSPRSPRRRSTSATRRTELRRRPRRGCASSSTAQASSSCSGTRRRAVSRPRRRSCSRCATRAISRVEPKQAWTPVAEFSAQGLDAVNLGPGATRYAHTRDERVEMADASADVRSAAAVRRYGGCVTPRRSPRSARRIHSFGSTRRRQRRVRDGIELIDFGMGDPIEPTPEFIQRALVEALPLTARLPARAGAARAARGDRRLARASLRRRRSTRSAS